ncbi:alpha-carboxyltransferase 2 [Trifolium medium]|uniref:Alpha-carboxyltransferase 2 n=1 Tax=Trifolium medium TaxID=97028 RepID=A0A392MKS0_9FABA|nr:alpha-carboxyltransferase 2 [Trifolium medium]
MQHREPIGGAHTDPSWTSQQIKIAINEAMDELTKLNTQDLLKDRNLKFRKLGGFQEGIPIDPKKGFNMRKRDIPVPPKISDSELEVEIEKLKQQISESPSAPPKFDLHKTIKKLEREVDQEFSEAVKALGLTERFSKLRDEVSKATSENQTIDPLLQDKIEKLNADFNQRLSAAPNSNKLQKKRDMLRELTEVKLLLDRNKETVRLKQKLKKKFDDVINNPRIKENYEALQSEIQRVGASSASDLDDELKKKITEFNKEVDLQLANAVKSVGLDDQFIKPGQNGSESLVPEIEELNNEVEKEIEILANSSTDFKRMIEELKVEVAKAGGTPDSESKNRIDDLTQKIKQSLAEATGSSSLKYENLVSKISGNGSLKAGESLTDDELREKIGANLNFS